MKLRAAELPHRPAWIEIDLAQLRRNFEIIHSHRPGQVQLLSVVKDNAYQHGLLEVATTALATGTSALGVVTLSEALALRAAGITAPILLLGERQPDELPYCAEHDLAPSVNSREMVQRIAAVARKVGRRMAVHLKVNTGMNRYGVRWTEAAEVGCLISSNPDLVMDGIYSHFAMSDELDKTFAQLQLSRFREALQALEQSEVAPGIRHLCNSGGFLDLPEAHFDMVRVGLLALGVYPSQVCRRLPGIAPIMSVKARIAAFQQLQPGDKVGYGMRYTAETPRRIAVIPLGYGDGFPRVRNSGSVLIHGKRAPVVGGVAMDAFTVDVTHIPEAQQWDEVVVQGVQGSESIDVHEVAQLKGSVSYDVLTNWRERLPRVYLNAQSTTSGSGNLARRPSSDAVHAHSLK